MFKTVNEEVKLFRMAICKSCDDFNESFKTCKICHCYMPAKTTFAASFCPTRRWSASTPGTDLINTIEEQILESWDKQ